MPSSRDPNKVVVSCWVHKDIHAAMRIVTRVSGKTVTRFILEALAEKMRFSLDEQGNPVGLDVGALALEAVEAAKPPKTSETKKSS